MNLDRPLPFRRPVCWLYGHLMTVTLRHPFCLRCRLGMKR